MKSPLESGELSVLYGLAGMGLPPAYGASAETVKRGERKSERGARSPNKREHDEREVVALTRQALDRAHEK
jgi:hypothetical protein